MNAIFRERSHVRGRLCLLLQDRGTRRACGISHSGAEWGSRMRSHQAKNSRRKAFLVPFSGVLSRLTDSESGNSFATLAGVDTLSTTMLRYSHHTRLVDTLSAQTSRLTRPLQRLSLTSLTATHRPLGHHAAQSTAPSALKAAHRKPVHPAALAAPCRIGCH